MSSKNPMTELFLFSALVLSSLVILTRLVWNRLNLSLLQKLVFLLTLSLPFERIPSVSLGGVNVRVSQILVLLGSYLLLVLLLKKDKELLKTNVSSSLNWLLLFCFSLVPSVFMAINQTRQLQALLATFLVFGACFLVSNFSKDIQKNTKWLSWVLVGVGVFGIYQFVADFVGVPSTFTLLREQYTKAIFGFARVQATAIEPLYWGGMVQIGMVYFLNQILTKDSSKTSLKITLVHIAGLSILFLNLILTLSRGAYLSFGVTLLMYFILAFKNIYFKKVLNIFLPYFLIIVLVVTVFLTNFASPKLIDSASNHVVNVFSGKQASTSERLNFLNTALDLLPENVLLGIGSGNYGPRAEKNILDQTNDGWLIVNNVYVEILLEQGFLSLIVFLSMFLFYLASATKKIWQKTADVDNSLILLSATIGGYLVQWLTFSPIFIMPIFILLGLLIAGLREKHN
jgi:O-antigen ligase